MNRFEECLELSLESEGGYTDNPKDTGGPTNKGVTLRTFQNYYGRDKTPFDLKNMNRDQLERIYKDGYWDKIKGDDLPLGIDYLVFDTSIHAGPARASRFLQRCVMAKEDGVIGPITLSELLLRDFRTTVLDYVSVRMNHLESLSSWSDFANGWTARMVKVQSQSLSML